MPRTKGAIDSWYLTDEELLAEDTIRRGAKGLRHWQDPHGKHLKYKAPSYNNTLREPEYSLMEMCRLAHATGRTIKQLFGVELGIDKDIAETGEVSIDLWDRVEFLFRSHIPQPDWEMVLLKASGMGWIKLSRRTGRPVSVMKEQYKRHLKKFYYEYILEYQL